MKRILMVLALVAIIATGTAFADHPDGWGIGAVSGSGMRHGYSGYWGLSLKAPMLPVYWGFYADFWNGGFMVGATGDLYLIDNVIIDPLLHWYLGAGALFNFYSWGNGNYVNFIVGARVPIGLSLQVDIEIIGLELFLAAVPNLTVGFGKNNAGFDFNINAELGIRIWL